MALPQGHLDPLGERFLDDAVEDVDHPLSGEPESILSVRQVVIDNRVVSGLGKDRLQVQSLVLRAEEILDSAVFDI